MGFSALLPDPCALTGGQVHIVPDRITITLRTSSPIATCPLCGRSSARVHSRYTRTLSDLPWHGTAVRLALRVRRLFCDAASCPRRIFAERVPNVAAAYARQTVRLAEALRGIAFTCGGEGGARLTRRLGMPTSPDTLLRRIRETLPVDHGVPRVLGVDDWAYRRGQKYGTILCDLEQHRPLDLLPERSAETLTRWLVGHPGIEIISRDRASYYAQGATQGAPQAIQVADRWHLLHNLHDALARMLDRRYRHLHAAAGDVTMRKRRRWKRVPVMNQQKGQPHPSVREQGTSEARHGRRYERYERVIALHGQGMSQRGIAKRLGIHRETVARFIHAGQFPERAPRPYARRTDPFAEYLWQRWLEGCRNAAQLSRELKERGFAGSYAGVRRCVARWRRDGPNGMNDPPLATMRAPSPKRSAWLLLKDTVDLSCEERAFVEALYRRSPEVRSAASLAQAFAEMVRERRSDELDEWIDRTNGTDVPKQLRSFATGLRSDYAAVNAALSMEWNNGQVEGQVNRLKLIKRQMYGRAKFDLLRLRVLYSG